MQAISVSLHASTVSCHRHVTALAFALALLEAHHFLPATTLLADGPAESVGVGTDGHLNYPEQLSMIDVCAVGPLRVTASLYKAGLLAGGRSKAIIITSQAGSCEWRFTQNPAEVGQEFHGNYGHHMSRMLRATSWRSFYHRSCALPTSRCRCCILASIGRA